MGEILYHLTTENNYKNILKEGLKPLFGNNSNKICEERKGIYLCKKEDIPYWNILLGDEYEYLLEVNIDKNDIMDSVQYSLYSEFIVKNQISKEKIKLISLDTYFEFNIKREEAMRELCLSYLKYISMFTYLCAIYYEFKKQNSNQQYDYKDKIKYSIMSILSVIDKLDFNIINKNEIKNILKDDGEYGLYTLCDTYLNTRYRLYQQLIHYPKDEFSEDLYKIYNWINKKNEWMLRC